MSEPGRDFLAKAFEEIGAGILADSVSANLTLRSANTKLEKHGLRPIQGFFRVMYDVEQGDGGLAEAGH